MDGVGGPLVIVIIFRIVVRRHHVLLRTLTLHRLSSMLLLQLS